MEFRVKFEASEGHLLVDKSVNLGLNALDIARGKLEKDFNAKVFAENTPAISIRVEEVEISTSEFAARKSGFFKESSCLTFLVHGDSLNRFVVVDYLVVECKNTNAVISVTPFLTLNETALRTAWLDGTIIGKLQK